MDRKTDRRTKWGVESYNRLLRKIALMESRLRLIKAVVDAQGGQSKYGMCSVHIFVLSIE